MCIHTYKHVCNICHAQLLKVQQSRDEFKAWDHSHQTLSQTVLHLLLNVATYACIIYIVYIIYCIRYTFYCICHVQLIKFFQPHSFPFPTPNTFSCCSLLWQCSLSIQLLECPIPTTTTPARHKKRQVAISREPSMISYIRW